MEQETVYIEKYFNNSLSDSDYKAFNEKMISDTDFAQKVKEHALLLNAFDELQAVKLMDKFNQIESDLAVKEKRNIKFSPLLKWAAVLALFMMVSAWFIWSKQQTNEELFTAYYTTYPNVEKPVVRSDTNPQGAWVLYSSGKYKEAYQQFRHSIGNGNAHEAEWFYLGICALELNRYNQAEEAFNNVILANEGRYLEQAKWYLALNYLKANQKIKAIKSLEEIENSASSYSIKAGELLNKLK